MRRSEFMMGGLKFEDLVTAQMMEGSVVSAHVTATWHDMTEAMAKGGFGDIPITDDDNNLLGIVTEYDLLKALMECKEATDVEKFNANDIMTKEPLCATEEMHVSEVIDIMETKHLIRLPVVKDGKLVGIIARRDVLLAYLNATAQPPGTL